MDILNILKDAVSENASDIFIISGKPIGIRVKGNMQDLHTKKVMPDDTQDLITQIYSMAGKKMGEGLEGKDDDFSFSVPGIARFRISVFSQRGSLAAVIRAIRFEIPDSHKLSIPGNVMDLAEIQKGLVLVTGSAGSGKSTTLACIINRINQEKSKHIITIEEPLEYLHRHEKSTVTQREVGIDTKDYASGLKSALRQSPDVILLGEMRDSKTISIATTAAETGHLIFSTLHTIGCSNTINRIVDAFPSGQQKQVLAQLSMTLQCIVSQQLIPALDGGVIPAFEVMCVNHAIKNMIRDGKIPQIEGTVYSSGSGEFISMDTSLLKLYKDGKISKEVALSYARNPDLLSKRM